VTTLARGFSRQHRITCFTPTGSPSDLKPICDGFAYRTPYILSPGQPPPGTGYLPASPRRSPTTDSGHRPTTALARRLPTARTGLVSSTSALTVRHGYGNINPLSIDYACRPRLRPRLTLGGTAWPRNPWSIGARDSHSRYRYSCLHSHSHTLHDTLTGPLHRTCDAPLPNTGPDRHPLR
jgi:hypothetical protein